MKRQIFQAFFFSTVRTSVNLSKNYYSLLQVDRKCDQKMIKNSYLKLVKKLHPDVNPKGKQKFTQVQQAYQILSNVELKTYYDQNYSTNNSKKGSSNQNNASNSTNYSQSDGQYKEKYKNTSYQRYQQYYKNQESSKKNNENESSYNNKKANKQQLNQRQYKARQRKYAYQRYSKQYQKQEQQHRNKYYSKQALQQKRIRDKLNHLREFTSSYNVMWHPAHIKYSNLFNNNRFNSQNSQTKAAKNKQKGQKYQDQYNKKFIKRFFSDRVQIFYQKIINKLQELSKDKHKK